MKKIIPRTILTLYLLALLWLVLFKFSSDIFSIVANFQMRSLNLVPFLGVSPGNMADTIYNLVVFVPFGLLLGVNFKQINVWHKLALVFIFSFAVEMCQFVLAIGTTDITDVIMNTFGGLVGLALYSLANKYIDSKILDRCIMVASVIIFVVFILLRTFVFKVKYQ